MDWESYQQAMELRELARPEDALSKLSELVGTSTDSVDNATVYVGISNCYREMGRTEEAREYVAKAYATLDETSDYLPCVIFNDASIDDDLGNRKEALSKLNSILRRFPSVLTDTNYDYLGVAIQGLRGLCLYDAEEYAEAGRLLELAVKNNYWKERTLFCLGACCYRLGYLPQAERYLSEALLQKLTPTYATHTHYFLGMALLWQQKYGRARQEFEWCLQNDETGAVRRDYVINGLVKASDDMGLHEDAKRYSAMLRKQ